MHATHLHLHNDRPHLASGFSIIELMVAIGIIVILAGITIVVASSMRKNSESRETEIILATCLSALTEYEVQMGGRLMHDDTPSTITPVWSGAFVTGSDTVYTYDDTAVTIPNITIERFVYAATQQPEAERNLRPLEKYEALIDTEGDGLTEIVDAWGTPIYFAAKIVKPADATYGLDSRLSISRDPVFVSAGPDRYFGDVNNFVDENNDGNNDDADNLYSSEVR